MSYSLKGMEYIQNYIRNMNEWSVTLNDIQKWIGGLENFVNFISQNLNGGNY